MWLNTFLVRLRALPPENDSQPPVPETVPHESDMQGPTEVTGLQGAKIAPLSDRIDAFNYSLDFLGAYRLRHKAEQPTFAIQGYIQLRPQTEGTLPAFGFDSQSSSNGNVVTESGVQPASKRLGKAFPSVSIFSRDPLCKNTCRYCRCQPCDVGVEHDDHTCYSCEQRLLHPGGVHCPLAAPAYVRVSPGVPNALLNVALYVDYMSSMSVWTVSIL